MTKKEEKISTEEKIAILKSVGEEIITEEEVKKLIKEKEEKGEEFIAYDGFEPSGKIHIAQAVMRAININKIVKAGGRFKMLVADWHAWANNKLGGDLEKIRKVGEYFIEVWKASGMNLDKVEFVWASDLIKDPEYWSLVMKIAINTTLKRVLRTTQIMGRSEKETLQASQILYPCMQAADIFYLKADVCQLGMDQRKVNMLAREVGEKLGYWKPIIISHHMLMGLSEPPKEAENAVERAIAMKMSKSKPDTAIFVTDTEEEIKRKIKKAYCPEKEVEENPIMEYQKYIIFEKLKEWGEELIIKRPEKFGGDLVIKDYEELSKKYSEGKIHPLDLKNATAEYINRIISPIREHFENDEKAKKLKEEIEEYTITR